MEQQKGWAHHGWARRASSGGSKVQHSDSLSPEMMRKHLDDTIKLANSRNKLEKFAACRALSSVEYKGDYSAWGALMAKLEDNDKDVRRQACIGLGIVSRRGDQATIKALVAAYMDREWSVREAAVRSMVQIDSGFKHEGEMTAAGPSLSSISSQVDDDVLNTEWKPACATVRETVAKAMNDVQAEVRCTATYLIGECVRRGDGFAMTCILQAGGEVMSIWSIEEERWERMGMATASTSKEAQDEEEETRPNTPFPEEMVTFLGAVSSGTSSGGGGEGEGGDNGSSSGIGSVVSATRSSSSMVGTPLRVTSTASTGFGKGAGGVVSSGGGGGGGGFDAKFSSASTMSLGMSLIKSWGGVASIGTHNWQPQFVPPGVGETAAVRMASVGYGTLPSVSSAASVSESGVGSEAAAAVVRGRVFYGLIGQHVPLSGRVVWCQPVHPPLFATHDAIGDKGAVDWVAAFRLPAGSSSELHYDCCLRAIARGACGVAFVCRDPQDCAVGVIKHGEAFRGPEEMHPDVFGVPVVYVGEDCVLSLEAERSCVYLEPNPSMRQARFDDKNPLVRVAAAKAVVKIAKQDDLRVLKGLLELMVDDDRDVRNACSDAFKNERVVSKCNAVATMGLAELTMHDDAAVRESAIVSMIKVTKNDGEEGVDHSMVDVAVSALRERLNDPEGMLRKMAVEALVTLALADGNIDADDMAIIDTFIDAMFDPTGDPVVTTQCAKSLVLMSNEPPEVSVGFNWLVDGRVATRKNALKSLSGGTRGNLIILTVLKKMVDDDEGLVREAAIEALIKIAPEEEYEWLEIALGKIGDRDSGVKRAVCHACVALLDATDLPFCSTVCDSLISLLKDTSSEVREACIDAMGKIASISQDLMERALSGVWKSMDSDDRTLRKSALLALPKIVEIGHPGLVEGVVRGILDPYSETKKLAIGMIRTHIPDSLTHEPRYDDLRAALIEVSACENNDEALVRSMALDSLPLVFVRGERDAVMALVRGLRSDMQAVQETCARVLGDLSDPGDERAISLMVPLMESKMGYIRRSAISSLSVIAMQGDPRVLGGIMKLLDDVEQYVRRECCEALPKISSKGLQESVGALAMLCNDMDEKIRSLAISGLGVVANKGDRVAIKALVERMRLEGRSTRREAIAALRGLIDGGDSHSMSMILNCIEDSDDVVRQVAIDCVIENATKGDAALINGILGHQFVDDNRKTREAASKILLGIAVPGDPDVVNILEELLSSDSAPVRRETCHVLSKLAFTGDDKTIVALGRMIGDKDADVKAEAVKAMGVVAGCKNDVTILQVLSEKLQSKDWSERECAANAMMMHADRGNESAVSTVSALLKHQDVYVRSTAVSLLTKLSLPCVCKVASGDLCLCKTVPLLLESTHDELPVIRKAAIEALELIANRKDKRVADRVKREMLSDKDFSVRGAVEHAIGVFLG